MQAIGLSATITDQVKAQFSVSTFHGMVYFAFRDFYFTHDDFEVPNQGLHFGVHILLRRKIKLGYWGKIFTLWHRHQFGVSLFKDTQALPDFFIAYAEAIIHIAGLANGDGEIKILIRRIRIHDPHIVINSGSTEVGTSKTVIEGFHGIDATDPDGAVHKNPVAGQQSFEFFPHFGEFIQKFADAAHHVIVKITLKTADAANIGGQARATDLFVNLVNMLPLLEHIYKTSQSSGVYTNYTVADQVVGDAGQLHDHYPHVIYPLGGLHPQQFFYG